MRIVVDGATNGRDTLDLASALTRLGHDVTLHDGHRGEQNTIARLTGQWQRVRPSVVTLAVTGRGCGHGPGRHVRGHSRRAQCAVPRHHTGLRA
ncbi:hypothetical protein CLV71_101692 [Actinophytocola oryzae]|uniref:Uncharacterized protein n=1 Tax=Actinophytocola oryzae TaxID=502181 RepID=A0A4R7W705_9PSEU|nr:hypothetical protein CLV71_101692 [Actinophytocola oryzae]